MKNLRKNVVYMEWIFDLFGSSVFSQYILILYLAILSALATVKVLDVIYCIYRIIYIDNI